MIQIDPKVADQNALLERVRERLARERIESAGQPARDPFDDLREQVRVLDQLADPMQQGPVTTHRRFGMLIIVIKKGLNWFMRRYMGSFLHRQADMNRGALTLFDELIRVLEEQRREIKTLRARVDAAEADARGRGPAGGPSAPPTS